MGTVNPYMRMRIISEALKAGKTRAQAVQEANRRVQGVEKYRQSKLTKLPDYSSGRKQYQ